MFQAVNQTVTSSWVKAIMFFIFRLTEKSEILSFIIFDKKFTFPEWSFQVQSSPQLLPGVKSKSKLKPQNPLIITQEKKQRLSWFRLQTGNHFTWPELGSIC